MLFDLCMCNLLVHMIIIFVFTHAVPLVVKQLFNELSTNYIRTRQRPYEEEWPPCQPTSFVNLALIHYKGTRTQQELFTTSKVCKEGASYVDKLTLLHSNITKNIEKIFVQEGDNESPKRILIEGAPGIGKTVLAKEIAFQWANGKILQDCKLVFLIYLRDPKLHSVKSFNEILTLFTSVNTSDLLSYVKSYAKHVAFVFDGFDEYPISLQKVSFITDLIKGVHNGNIFLNSTVVVTSRPTATLFLHRITDRRIEILGFPKEERDNYIAFSLGDSLVIKQEFDKYLKKHPIINNLCYIPLHLAILIYLFQQGSLPETLTEMNESFVLHTIYRYLEKQNLTPPGIAKRLKDLPEDILKFVHQLSQLAFEGLCNNQLVFTGEEIKEVCPEIDNTPGAINGFGLLQAVQHYAKVGAGKTISVNFLHFTMQEYFAALHISSLPSEEQSSLMKETFWNGQFNFMWMMYVGIVGVKSNIFSSFITSDICNDKIKCLHLFQCYVEANSNAEMPKAISYIFTDGQIILSTITLLPHHISSLVFFMSASSFQEWKILKLNRCNIGDIGMNSILEHFIKKDDAISTLEYVDLSENRSSPWSVYCVIIEHCCINSLTLFGDKGMKEHVKEITSNLQRNTTLQSLTLCKIGKIGLESIKVILDNNTTLKELNLSWGKDAKGIRILNTRSLYNNNRVVNINILYDDYHECLSKTINLFRKNIDDVKVHLLSFGLCNNTTVKKIDLSCNSISNDGMNRLSECIKYPILLEYIDLSGNKSSPWGVYCAVIRYCCANNLTLFGDEGIKQYVKDITESLQANTTLKSLTLCKIGEIRLQLDINILIKNVAMKELFLPQSSVINGRMLFSSLDDKPVSDNSRVVDIYVLYNSDYYKFSSKVINLSNKSITEDTICLISLGLYYNKSVKKLNFSHSNINNVGVIALGDSLQNNTTLKELNLSQNQISINGMNRLSECVKHNIPLEFVDLSGNKSSPWDLYCTIIKNCRVKSLTLCGIKGVKEYVRTITECLQKNKTLKSLTLCGNKRMGWSYEYDIVKHLIKIKQHIADITIIIGRLFFNALNNSGTSDNSRVVDINILYHHDHKSPKSVLLSNESISDDVACFISLGLYNNTAISKLDLSHNNITDIGATAISTSLQNNYTLKELNLAQNQISISGMNKLSECVKHPIPLEYINLSENESSPWGLYCTIIKHCCVTSLTLCGNEGMKEYIMKITDSLQQNTTLQSLTIYANVSRSKNMVIRATQCSKRLPVISGNFFSTLIGDDGKVKSKVVNIRVLYDDDYDYLPYTISLSNKNINDDAACLIVFGLYNNKKIQKLDFSCNNITDVGVLAIANCFRNHVLLKQVNINSEFALLMNRSLQILDISYNNISDNGAIALSDCLKNKCTLQELYLSNNQITTKGAKKIGEAIQVNDTLQKLSVSNNALCDGILAIGDSLKYNKKMSDLNLSQCQVTIEGAKVIAKAIRVNTTLQKLDISHNNISDDGVISISECLKSNSTLQELNLSLNRITNQGAVKIAEAICVNATLQRLSISHNSISDDGVIVISDCLKNNNSLQELYLSWNRITDRGAEKIAEAIQFNKTLQKLDISHNSISDDRAIIINECLKGNTRS